MNRKPATSFRDLIVWQKAHALVLDIYRFSDLFPKTELYGLTSQLRRAGVSIPANIAEGFKKKSKPDKARFMNIAQGSLEECRYYFILSQDLGYGNTEQLLINTDEVGKLLDTYTQSILSSVS
ncbi:MAG: four helix bundle protein [Chitinispirillaceae bacterium]|nr:four helix bundle protein [Chitinispirillaceae bacterium]